jgi:hypothetical protein
LSLTLKRHRAGCHRQPIARPTRVGPRRGPASCQNPSHKRRAGE